MSDVVRPQPTPFSADRPAHVKARDKAKVHPLPTVRHLPGSGSQPDLIPLEAVKALVPARTEAEAWSKNQPFLYGIALFEAGFYWEAHEVWEPVWMNAAPNSAERHLLQALIQYANAALKRDMARPRAARRLLDETARHLGRAVQAAPGDTFMGVDLIGWQATLDAQLAPDEE